jgi:transcriptional regulator GlxA family with amidase domain
MEDPATISLKEAKRAALAFSEHVRDGQVYTSAGVTAGVDLCPAIVEEDDEGHDIAVQVARELVLFLRRSGTITIQFVVGPG